MMSLSISSRRVGKDGWDEQMRTPHFPLMHAFMQSVSVLQ
jgi:hypothetical protein